MTRIVIITGTSGAGKTTVCQSLADALPGTVAYLSGDTIALSLFPFDISDDRRQFIRENCASFAKHAIAHGYDWVLLEYVILKDVYVDDLISRMDLDGQQLDVIAIDLANRDLLHRLKSKPENRSKDDRLFEPCYQWAEEIRSMKRPRPFDSTGLSIEQTVDRIGQLLDVELSK